MKHILARLAVAAASAVLVAQAARAAESWDEVKSYTVEKKNDAVAFGRKLVAETDARIKTLEVDASKSTGEVKAAHEANMKELKAKRAQAAARLDDMGKATGKAWDATKTGFADAYQDLHKAVDKAATSLKKK